ncbi:Translocase of chloroplast 34, partial [Cucurbita argyrosperma subsp. sororia]
MSRKNTSPPARLRLQLLVDRGAHSFMASQVIREWIGINNFAMATQVKLLELLGRLKLENVSTLTILVMGKGGVGKSSTVNSIIGERAVSVSPFQSEVPRPVMVSRSRAGFTLNIIDTPGIIEGGCINDQTLEIIKRVDNLEKQVIKAITNSFGKAIWNRALVVLTHAQFSPPDGVPYEEFFSRRSEALLKTVRFGASFNKKDIQALNIPVVLVENSGRCNKNEKDEKVLPNGIAWIPHLVEAITAVVLKEGTKSIFVDKNLIAGPNPNQRGKLLIPFIVVLQYLFAVRPIERAIRSDILNESRPSWETHEY